MLDITDEHIKQALSVACETTREGDLQVLDAVADNLDLSDDGILQALRAALNYMLVVDGQRKGWGAFGPMWEIDNKVYPPPLSQTSPSWHPIWERAFFCAPYAYIQARFADLLWEAKYGGQKRHEWGQRAIDAYLQALDEPFGEDVYLVEGACRALGLTKSLGDKKRQPSAIRALRNLARDDLADCEYVPGVTLRSLAALVSLPPEDRPPDLSDLIDAAYQCEKAFHTRLQCLELKLGLAETEEDKRFLWEAQVEIHADEARTSTGLAQFHHFENAVQLAEERGLKDLANDLKRESEPLSEDSLQRVETTVEIPASEVEEEIGRVVGDDNLSNALRRFGRYTPSGDPAGNRALAQKVMNQFVFASLATTLVTNNEGRLVKKLQTPEEKMDYQVISLEALGIRIFAGIAVNILTAIRKRYGPIGDENAVFASGLVDKTQAEWIALAVRHYEAGDYRSSVSVMAPRLENAIRDIAQRVGIATWRHSIRSGRTGGEKPFGRLLKDFKGLVPETNRRYWRTLLAEPLGVNLRNRVAHGLIDHPSPADAAILIHTACQMLTPHPPSHQKPSEETITD